MKRMFKYELAVTTDSSGNYTGYTPSMRGRIHVIKWAHNDIPLCPVTITGETTGVPILVEVDMGDADRWDYVRAAATKRANGDASTLTEVDIWVYNERIKVVIASGTASKTGTMTFFVELDT